MVAGGNNDTDPVVAFVGVLADNEPTAHGDAFNRAGQMFQEGLLHGLAAAGLPANIILGLEPIPAFPRSKRLASRGGTFTIAGGRVVHRLPFLNIHPLKWLTAGVSVLAALVSWSWKHRGKRRIVHTVNLSMPPGLFVWIAGRLTGAKTLVSVLDVFRPGELVPDTLFRRWDFAMHRWLLPRYDGLMIISSAIATDFVPGRRVCLVEGGIPSQAFAGSAPERARPAGGDIFRIVLAGSLEPYNGVLVALDAVQHLPPGYELVFAGKGALATRVRDAAARDARIIYRGFLEFSEVLELYRSADLVLSFRLTLTLDTRYFFPSKLMELLASGTPVLSTCTGHVEEAYGGLLYLLRDETAQAAAERIVEISRIPVTERRALASKARAFMLAEKTWERQGERLAEYIRTELLQ